MIWCVRRPRSSRWSSWPSGFSTLVCWTSWSLNKVFGGPSSTLVPTLRAADLPLGATPPGDELASGRRGGEVRQEGALEVAEIVSFPARPGASESREMGADALEIAGTPDATGARYLIETPLPIGRRTVRGGLS